MNRYLRIAAVAVVLAIVAAACGKSTSAGTTSSSSGGGAVPTGGTLKTAMTQDFFHGLDPQEEYYSVSWEFLRCCMARTLLSYNGKPAAEEGGVPKPDLATALPDVSSDGLTYTFHLKAGVKYGDPLNRPIVAGDFVNAINRFADGEINGTAYPFYYTDIAGFDDKWHNGAKTVSGVSAPTPDTFVVQMANPNPDVLFLFAMAATAPIPDELMANHYKAVEMGQFLVSSGPYQWEGMDALDPAMTGTTPPSGMQIEKSYVFVRNPSYDPATDDLRKAYPDRIEITVGGEVQSLLDQVDAGAIDWCIDCGATSTSLKTYQSDPKLYNPGDPAACDPQPCRLQVFTNDVLYYTGLNVFQAPFDDVHVRKAVNWALDKNAMYRLAGGAAAGQIAGHFIPPSMLGGLLSDYDPYASPDHAGDPAQAQAEMKQSKYDTTGDGKCDGAACTITALTISNDNDSLKAVAIMQESFKAIGLTLEVKTLNYNALVSKCATLASHTAFCQAGWGKDYPSPYTFFYPLLDGGENGSNYAFMGTTAEALKAAGYSVPADGIPAITDDITACRAVPVGAEQDQCWANLDTKVMETFAPVIPRRFGTAQDILGSRIVNYSFDQFAGVGDPGQMALSV